MQTVNGDSEQKIAMSPEQGREAAKVLREFRTSLAKSILTFLGVPRNYRLGITTRNAGTLVVPVLPLPYWHQPEISCGRFWVLGSFEC